MATVTAWIVVRDALGPHDFTLDYGGMYMRCRTCRRGGLTGYTCPFEEIGRYPWPE